VVVNVAEVALVRFCQPGQLGHPAHQSGEGVALRGDRLAHPDEEALHPEDLLQLRVARLNEDLVLELVNPVVELGQDREEAVDQPVDDPVEQERGLLERRLAPLIATADLRERGEVVPMDRDEEALGVEAMHLDQPVPVVSRPVNDDEDEVVVPLDLRPLIEVLRVLDGKRMKLENLTQDLESPASG